MNNLQSLVKKARKFIDEQRCFLLVYDVIGSGDYAKYYGYEKLYGCLKSFQRAVNRRFCRDLFINEIALGKKLSKFETIVGDSGGAYFSDLKVIKPIMDLANKMLPFRLRWMVAKDGWDKKLKKFL